MFYIYTEMFYMEIFCNLSVPVAESMQGNLIILGVFVPFENFSLIWKRYHYRPRIATFDLYSALMPI